MSDVQLSELTQAYRARVMGLNGVDPSVTGKFNVTPEIEQKLEDKIRETSDFLGRINIIGVRDQIGSKVGLDFGGPIASRTDTSQKDRQTKDNITLDDSEYHCRKTDFDTHIKYARLDTWSRFPDFQSRVTNAITRQIARDRLMIGFNGEIAAAETDAATYPLLQDVNIGWLKHIQTNKASNFLAGLKVGSTAGNDFANLDAAIYAARHEFIAPWYRNDTDLVAIMGSGLVVDKNVAAIEGNEAPTERAALNTLMLNNLIGTLRPIIVPFIPATTVLITSEKNLSIYYQRGSRRRTIVDNAKRDQLEDFQSVNEAYVVEDYDKCAVLSGILKPNAAEDGWE